MKRLLKHKYLVILLVFLALAVAVYDVSAPMIEEYNRNVAEKQQELYFAAGGTQSKRSMFSPTDCFPQPKFLAIFSLLFSFTLMFTRRIFLSFLFIFLFAVELVIAAQLFMIVPKQAFNFYFDYIQDYLLYYETANLFFILTSSFWLALCVEKRLFSRQTIKNPLV